MKKRKKNSRQRGGTTHGWGAMKKHRGAGNRGGRGNAGSGKRGDAKKPSYWKDNKYFGMSGFVRKGKKIQYKCINIGQLEALAKKIGKTELNLADYGYNKLLGTGSIKKPLKILVDYATQKAISKMSTAKGELIIKNKDNDSKAGKSVEVKDTKANKVRDINDKPGDNSGNSEDHKEEDNSE